VCETDSDMLSDQLPAVVCDRRMRRRSGEVELARPWARPAGVLYWGNGGEVFGPEQYGVLGALPQNFFLNTTLNLYLLVHFDSCQELSNC